MVSHDTSAADRQQHRADDHRACGTPSSKAAGSAYSVAVQPDRDRQRRDRQQRAGAGDRVVDAAGDAGVLVGRRGQHGRGQRRDHQRQARGRRRSRRAARRARRTTSAPIRSSSSTPTAITIGPTVIGIRGPIRMPSRPPREASSSITSVIGTNAAPAASAPYPLTVWSWMVTKKLDRAERAVDQQGHHVGGAEGPVAEDAQHQHRLALARLDHEEADRRPATPTADRDPGGGAAPLDQRVRRPAERHGGEHRPDDVEVRGGVRVAGLRHRT